MKTRKRRRSKNENSQSSSNSLEIKRRKSKEMSEDLQSSIEKHDTIYKKLLEQVCSGLDHSMGPPNNDSFWIGFALNFCGMTGLENKEGMAVACQRYCDELKSLYKYYKKTCTPHSINTPSLESWAIMSRIFGGCTPSTSTGRSSRSRGDTSSISSKKGRRRKAKLDDCLAKLSYDGHLDFDDIGKFKEYVSKSETHLQTFLGGSQVYKEKVVRMYLAKYSEETEVQDSMVVRRHQPY